MQGQMDLQESDGMATVIFQLPLHQDGVILQCIGPQPTDAGHYNYRTYFN